MIVVELSSDVGFQPHELGVVVEQDHRKVGGVHNLITVEEEESVAQVQWRFYRFCAYFVDQYLRVHVELFGSTASTALAAPLLTRLRGIC